MISLLQKVKVHSLARVHIYTENTHFERKMQFLMQVQISAEPVRASAAAHW